MKDVIVIGLGPAGITASLYILRAKLSVLGIEKFAFGGQINLTYRIENYPGFPDGISGYELAELFKKQIDNYGLEVVTSEVMSLDIEDNCFEVVTKNGRYQALAIVIATGASPRKLGVKGEREFTGRGVSYCATCDAPFYKDKITAVVGGGNTACEEALYLAKFCKKVYLIHRRDRLRAEKFLQDRIFATSNVELVLNSTVEEIKGDEKVDAVVVKNLKQNKVTSIEVDGIFIFVGHKPNTDFCKHIIEVDSNDYIITDSDFQTSVKGIFAAGDVRANSLKQVISACGEGAKAGQSAIKYVERLKGTAYE
ncbi:MAG TPA: thioredoxin-disulfide reductase [Candidatus Omnitrophica bacterium]|nr:thioredoxin-disulfide reductase [Candidatus Omnitrophota bacterium]